MHKRLLEQTYFVCSTSKNYLGKTCVHLVREQLENKWGEYPQVVWKLWNALSYHSFYSQYSRLTRLFSALVSTVLFAVKTILLTDRGTYFSTVSTPPITTTTIYI